jgi:outer membrane receptor for monomeric catechols
MSRRKRATPEAAAEPRVKAEEAVDRPPTESATAAAAELPEELAAVTPDEATQAACTVDPPEHYTVSAPIGRLRVQAAKAAVKHLGQPLMEATHTVAQLPDEDVREIVACSLDPDIAAKLRRLFGVSD